MSVVEFVEGPDPLLAELKKIRQLLETMAAKPAVVTMQFPPYPTRCGTDPKGAGNASTEPKGN
jgi:hypothetical protein